MDDKNMECMTELEDFDLEPCEYRVLAHGFDLNGDELPGTLVLWANPDPDEAIKVAKEKLKNFEDLIRPDLQEKDGLRELPLQICLFRKGVC